MARCFPLPSPRLAIAGLGLALCAGCATQDELADLRREQRQLSRRVADTRADLESLRVSMTRLQGRIDDVTGGRTSRAPQTPDVESRLRALEDSVSQPPRDSGLLPGEPPPPLPGGVGAVPPSSLPPGSAPPPGYPPTSTYPPSSTYPPAAPAAGATVVASLPPPSDDVPRSVDLQQDLARGGSEQYREGLQAYQKGDYGKAVQSLRGFVNKEPKSDLVPGAQYWIGEAYYSQRRYNEAILAYNEILVGWPKSERVPAALLRQASAFAELGDKIDARLILQKLISDHPGTEEAASAKRKLLTLGS